jgi:hypothetical protein
VLEEIDIEGISLKFLSFLDSEKRLIEGYSVLKLRFNYGC